MGTPNAAPPCRNDPERWFDKHNRAYALERCLGCHHRSWCAQQALAGASYGMWAGIWIDDNLAELAPYLRAIADAAAGNAPNTGHQVAIATPSPTCIQAAPPPAATAQAQTCAPITKPDNALRAMLAVISARSSGHCEVMTPVCRYTFDTLASRIPGRPGWDATEASSAYAVCRPCQSALSITEESLLGRLGYLVEPPLQPAFTPLYWRQARWVYLDGGSTILDIDTATSRRHRAL
jgi:Transcription factor WhiB